MQDKLWESRGRGEMIWEREGDLKPPGANRNDQNSGRVMLSHMQAAWLSVTVRVYLFVFYLFFEEIILKMICFGIGSGLV